MDKTYGLMFKDEMIRAYIKKQKTQTRRLKGLETVNVHPDNWELLEIKRDTPESDVRVIFRNLKDKKLHYTCLLPYGDTLDTLWFRETWRAWEDKDSGEDFLLYRADNGKYQPFASDDQSWNLLVGKFNKWSSSMFMPHWASRFWNVPILRVRVERLHDITEADARAEGCIPFPEENPSPYKTAYWFLWNSINGKSLPWKKNPWVFVYEFPEYDPEQVSKIHPHQEEK